MCEEVLKEENISVPMGALFACANSLLQLRANAVLAAMVTVSTHTNPSRALGAAWDFRSSLSLIEFGLTFYTSHSHSLSQAKAMLSIFRNEGGCGIVVRRFQVRRLQNSGASVVKH